jgi:L-fuconolactonase
MTTVDAHVHLWDVQAHPHPWLADEDVASLRRTFTLADFTTASAGQPPDAAVIVQAGRSTQETTWLLETAAEANSPLGVVAYADLTDPDLFDHIDQHLAGRHGSLLVGVRDPLRGATAGLLGRAEVRRALAGLGERGLTFDLLIDPTGLGDVRRAATAIPQVHFVVDHAALPPAATEPTQRRAWRDAVTALAALPNIYCKLSGMPTIDAEVFAALLELFSPQRLMFGSDWPVCTRHSSYAEVVRGLADWVSSLAPDEKAWIWANTAASAYTLPALASAIVTAPSRAIYDLPTLGNGELTCLD